VLFRSMVSTEVSLQYKITVPTLALYCPDGERHIPVQLPADAVLSVTEIIGEIEVDGKTQPFVDVEWETKRVRMFALDLAERSQPVS